MIETAFTDISEWQRNFHYSTGGTRSKYIAIHPNTSEEYFFKGSKETPDGEIKYPTEFWSEIVASKIGQELGFPMLDYNIAYNKNNKQKIGCISKSMVLNSENKLTEGITYLTGYNPLYNPEIDKKDYTFQFIKKAIDVFNLGEYIKNILEIIIFDSIIGNSDRHQENWGLITKHSVIVKENITPNSQVEFDEKFYKKIKKSFKMIFKNDDNNKYADINTKNQNVEILTRFAPIYDSGCCLGREKLDNDVENMLKNNEMIMAYVNRGKSEIHWENFKNKKSHFELIKLLIEQYPNDTKSFISKVNDKYNQEIIKKTIYSIDYYLPEDLKIHKLSNSRKELMYKLVTLRVEKLINYL